MRGYFYSFRRRLDNGDVDIINLGVDYRFMRPYVSCIKIVKNSRGLNYPFTIGFNSTSLRYYRSLYEAVAKFIKSSKNRTFVIETAALPFIDNGQTSRSLVLHKLDNGKYAFGIIVEGSNNFEILVFLEEDQLEILLSWLEYCSNPKLLCRDAALIGALTFGLKQNGNQQQTINNGSNNNKRQPRIQDIGFDNSRPMKEFEIPGNTADQIPFREELNDEESSDEQEFINWNIEQE